MEPCKYCNGNDFIWVVITPDDVNRDICIGCCGSGKQEESQYEAN